MSRLRTEMEAERHTVEEWTARLTKGVQCLAAPRKFWEALEQCLPTHSLLWEALAVEVYRRELEFLEAEEPSERARLSHNLGAALFDLGRHEEARKAAEEAVERYCSLAEANPQRFLPDLAMSLNNLGAALAELGRHEEARKAAEEAVRILLPFCQAHPLAFRDRLQIAFENYLLACKKAKRAPDEALVEKVKKALS